MGAQFNANGEGFTRNTGVLNYNAGYTWMCWLFMNSAPSGFNSVFVVSEGTISDYDNTAFASASTTFQLGTQFGGTNGSTLSLSTWYHLASIRETGLSWKGYLNGALDLTNTFDLSATRPTSVLQEVSNLAGASRHIPGVFAAMKLWDVALGIDEVKNEMMRIRPVRLANLNGFYPIFAGGTTERVTDYSGLGRNWTETGTVDDAGMPPVSW